MPVVPNPRIVYLGIPDALPVVGQHFKYDDTLSIDLDAVSLDGGFLVKNLVISPDPYLRGRMRDPSIPSYSEPLLPGDVIAGYGICVVLRSERNDIKPGDNLYGNTIEWEAYTVHQASSTLKHVKRSLTLPWIPYVGVLGMPGKTAFYGYKAFADAKKGETIFVSSAAGAVGSIVLQLAKLDGLKVIASAGSPAKIDYIKSLGADVAFNYKSEDTMQVLKKEGPIDIYWDNVGGETLDAALVNFNVEGRIMICGIESQYNNKITSEGYAVKNISQVLSRRLHLHGFLALPLEARMGSDLFYSAMPKLVEEGKIKHKEHVVKGLENAPQAFVELLQGGNFGKSVVVIADE